MELSLPSKSFSKVQLNHKLKIIYQVYVIYVKLTKKLQNPHTSSKGADFSQLPTAPMQDFKVKPSTNHRANVLGQLPPAIIYIIYVLTEEVLHINSSSIYFLFN